MTNCTMRHTAPLTASNRARSPPRIRQLARPRPKELSETSIATATTPGSHTKAAEIVEASAKWEEPSKNQILVVLDGSVVGYSTIRWWQERDDTWLYLHRGYLLPAHRGRGIGSAMLSWAEERIRQLVKQHGTARTAVIGANAMACEQDATALLRAAGYRRVFSLVELKLGDLQQVPDPGSKLPAGIRTGPIGTSHYRAAWRPVVDSYADPGFTQRWPFRDFVDTADPAYLRAAWWSPIGRSVKPGAFHSGVPAACLWQRRPRA